MAPGRCPTASRRTDSESPHLPRFFCLALALASPTISSNSRRGSKPLHWHWSLSRPSPDHHWQPEVRCTSGSFATARDRGTYLLAPSGTLRRQSRIPGIPVQALSFSESPQSLPGSPIPDSRGVDRDPSPSVARCDTALQGPGPESELTQPGVWSLLACCGRAISSVPVRPGQAQWPSVAGLSCQWLVRSARGTPQLSAQWADPAAQCAMG